MIDLQAVREVFPETWTHAHNINWLQVGYRLKLAGVEWRDLPEVMARCEKAGVLLRDGYLVRRGKPFVPTVREDG